ncbi:MAG: Hpt domain-containing protein [Methyloceanibacter sp.]
MAGKPTIGAGVATEGRIASSRPVDLVHLSRYTLGERALERDVLELFCTQSFICLEQLRAARCDKDWQEAAHSLKGSARAIGAWRVAEGAEHAEAFSGETQSRAHHINEIESAVHEARDYIESLLTDTGLAAVR